jgi:hypothetical protein
MTADRPPVMASARAAALVRMLCQQVDAGAPPEAVRPILLALGKVLAADAARANAALAGAPPA